jgi:hypothetical protein
VFSDRDRDRGGAPKRLSHKPDRITAKVNKDYVSLGIGKGEDMTFSKAPSIASLPADIEISF